MIKTHPLHGPNRLKLGVFSTNADGGLAITDAVSYTHLTLPTIYSV